MHLADKSLRFLFVSNFFHYKLDNRLLTIYLFSNKKLDPAHPNKKASCIASENFFIALKPVQCVGTIYWGFIFKNSVITLSIYSFEAKAK